MRLRVSFAPDLVYNDYKLWTGQAAKNFVCAAAVLNILDSKANQEEQQLIGVWILSSISQQNVSLTECLSWSSRWAFATLTAATDLLSCCKKNNF